MNTLNKRGAVHQVWYSYSRCSLDLFSSIRSNFVMFFWLSAISHVVRQFQILHFHTTRSIHLSLLARDTITRDMRLAWCAPIIGVSTRDNSKRSDSCCIVSTMAGVRACNASVIDLTVQPLCTAAGPDIYPPLRDICPRKLLSRTSASWLWFRIIGYCLGLVWLPAVPLLDSNRGQVVRSSDTCASVAKQYNFVPRSRGGDAVQLGR